MRLEDITIPFLKYSLTISELAKMMDLTPTRIAVILKTDLRKVTSALNISANIDMAEIKNNRSKYLNLIDQYYKHIEKETLEKKSIADKERAEIEARLINATKKLDIWQLERMIRAVLNRTEK